jgi:hypothetical protein
MFAIRCKKHNIFPAVEKWEDGTWSKIICEECKKEYEKAGLYYPERYAYCGKLRRNRKQAIENWNEDNK